MQRNDDEPAPSRWHVVMASLLYPAFLGNMIYFAVDTAQKTPGFYGRFANTLLILALLLHYVLDYAYTVIDRGHEYPPFKFLADCGIVLCLYAALLVALEQAGERYAPLPEWFRQPVGWMLATKCLALAWEAWSAACRRSVAQTLALRMDGGFALAYLTLAWAGSAWLSAAGARIALAFVVLADAVGYVIHAQRESAERAAAGAPA